jgi:hypothetical protein
MEAKQELENNSLQKLAMKKLEIANRIRTFVYNYNVFK